MSRTAEVDVAIVGAGAAGIAAARRLRRRGLSCRLLEARGRLGGRAWTETTSLGLPLDRGCAWLHDARTNPLGEFAAGAGMECSGDMQARFHIDGGWADATQAGAIEAFLTANFRAIRAAGAVQDGTAAGVIEHGQPYTPLLESLLTAINGVEPERYSTAEAAAEGEMGENWGIREGLGTLIAERLGSGLPVTLDCPVRAVEHRADAVRLQTDCGALRARAVIITVSTGVLAAGGIDFRPSLPDWKLEAVAAVPMGHAEKIALAFDADVFGLPENTYVSILREGRVAGFHLRPFGRPLAVGYVGGAAARRLARLDPAAATAEALDALEHAFGATVRQRLRASTVTAWRDDPWTLGSYSAALPGRHAQRAALARPLTPRVQFAGEATLLDDFATVHGAWRSGLRAADAVATELTVAGGSEG